MTLEEMIIIVQNGVKRLDGTVELKNGRMDILAHRYYEATVYKISENIRIDLKPITQGK